jgi:twitching motility protein PilT
MSVIQSLLKTMIDKDASDIHLRTGVPPVFRIDGRLFKANMAPISPDIMQAIINDLMSEQQREKFAAECELDFAVGFKDIGRFRINAFRQRGTTSFAIRSTRGTIPAFSELKIPEVVLDLSMRKRGLILVTGATGSGKSTLLASMINHINSNASLNIVTIEDPIEFLHRDIKCVVAQREVGSDTKSFATALRACFRQDPDVIMIGEIRDRETMEVALSAADTGHLVMSTLHTMNAMETISRVISFFPPHQHEQIRLVFSSVLIGVISLRLLPRKDGQGRIPAVEILINNQTLSEYLLDQEKSHLIMEAVAEGYTQYGSQTFDQSLLRLYKDELITFQLAKQNANSPDDFELRVGGVEGTSDRRWIT